MRLHVIGTVDGKVLLDGYEEGNLRLESVDIEEVSWGVCQRGFRTTRLWVQRLDSDGQPVGERFSVDASRVRIETPT